MRKNLSETLEAENHVDIDGEFWGKREAEKSPARKIMPSDCDGVNGKRQIMFPRPKSLSVFIRRSLRAETIITHEHDNEAEKSPARKKGGPLQVLDFSENS